MNEYYYEIWGKPKRDVYDTWELKETGVLIADSGRIALINANLIAQKYPYIDIQIRNLRRL